MSAGAPTPPPAEAADTLEALGRRYRLEILRELDDALLDPSLIADVPVDWARAHNLLPVRRAGRVCVLTSAPADVAARQSLALLLGEDPLPLLADRALIAAGIERCYASRPDTARSFLEDLGPAGEHPPPASGPAASDLLQASADAPVSQLVNLILLEAVKAGASDVHIEPGSGSLRVRIRVDGILYEQASPPKHLQEALLSRLKVMARMDIAEKRLPQDGAARVRVGEREADLRVSTVPVADGERMVLRLLHRETALRPLTGLGLPAELLGRLERILDEPSGMLLAAGPTGSGKTTSLYAALQRLNNGRLNIMTIEDPVEVAVAGLGQIQVKPKIGLTFAGGLRHILRQDPDAILVGEIRDLETAEIAVRASLTGHLVLSTLHTHDAAGTVVRLADMGLPPYLLAACLRGVLAQRLVRRLCPACRRLEPPAPGGPQTLLPLPPEARGQALWTAVGCAACREGYRGRTGVFELLEMDAEFADAFRRGLAGAAALRELARRKGMRPLLEDAIRKALAGETTLAEVLRVVGTAPP
jgi:general secretion pathway protein E